MKYSLTLVVVLLCTAGAHFLDVMGLNEANIVMVYILGVTVTAAWLGLGAGMLISVMGVLLFDFFFTEPFYTFVVEDAEYFVTFGVMLGITFLTSHLMDQIRQQAKQAKQRHQQTDQLYRFSRKLTAAAGTEEIRSTAKSELSQLFQREVVVILPNDRGELKSASNPDDSLLNRSEEWEAARRAFKDNTSTGQGTSSYPDSRYLYVPMTGSGEPVGVLAIHAASSQQPLTDQQTKSLKTCATQVALALERDELEEETRSMLMQVEVERMRNALLSSLSHDLRTPLSSIASSARMLLNQSSDLDAKGRDLIETIQDEAQHLLHLVNNLLNMVKIESGSMGVEKEWQPLEEVVGSALNRMEEQLFCHDLSVNIPETIPMVPLDGTLIEQTLMNLLDNAVKYTPKGTRIEVRAEYAKSQVLVEIADKGPGLDEEKTDEIFEKFVSGNSEPDTRQSGLGLAICKAIVEAHGGRIWAQNRSSGGACFRFVLPIEGEAPRVPTTDELAESFETSGSGS